MSCYGPLTFGKFFVLVGTYAATALVIVLFYNYVPQNWSGDALPKWAKVLIELICGAIIIGFGDWVANSLASNI
jgi:hypothetical protein